MGGEGEESRGERGREKERRSGLMSECVREGRRKGETDRQTDREKTESKGQTDSDRDTETEAEAEPEKETETDLCRHPVRPWVKPFSQRSRTEYMQSISRRVSLGSAQRSPLTRSARGSNPPRNFARDGVRAIHKATGARASRRALPAFSLVVAPRLPVPDRSGRGSQETRDQASARADTGRDDRTAAPGAAPPRRAAPGASAGARNREPRPGPPG